MQHWLNQIETHVDCRWDLHRKQPMMTKLGLSHSHYAPPTPLWATFLKEIELKVYYGFWPRRYGSQTLATYATCGNPEREHTGNIWVFMGALNPESFWGAPSKCYQPEDIVSTKTSCDLLLTYSDLQREKWVKVLFQVNCCFYTFSSFLKAFNL